MNYTISLTEIFIEFINQVYYPGYAEQMSPEQFAHEFSQFSESYSK